MANRPKTIKELVVEWVYVNEMPPDLGAYILTMITLAGGNLETPSSGNSGFAELMEKYCLEEFGIKAICGPADLGRPKNPNLN